MASPSETLLIFQVEDQRYALPASRVREVVRAVAITPLPAAPGVVEGVINVRGTVVAVLDLRRRFGLPPRPPRPSDHLILASAGRRTVALRVDHVDDLVASPALETDDGLAPSLRHVTGIAQLAEGLVLIQDLDAFLSQAESLEVEAALERPGAPA